MPIMNEIKQGVDLTHPKPTVGYILAAIVAFVVLGVAYWLYMKAKNMASGAGKTASTMTSGLESQATKQLEGFL